MKKRSLFICSVVFLSACGSEQPAQDNNTSQQAPAEANGKTIFINNCIQCHSLHEDKVGPKLEGVMAKWDNDTTRIRAFIHNSQDAVKSGDPRAVAVYKEWRETLMTPMPHLTNQDIDQLLDYINKGAE
jgi:cytochrome c551/c552